MRLGLRDVERMPPLPFVLAMGMIAGVLRGLVGPAGGTTASRLAAFLLMAVSLVIPWWLSVRRRQHGVWSAALQLACAMSLAGLIGLAFTISHFFPTSVHLGWRDVAMKALPPQLFLFPIGFLESAALIVVGRALPGSGREYGGPHAAADSKPLDLVT